MQRCQKLQWVVFPLLLCMLICGNNATAAPVELKPEDAIRQVLDAQAAAWNKGDLEEFMKGYWNSEKLTFFSGGTKTTGWNATLKRYQEKYKSKDAEMGKLTFSELDIEVLSPDSAVVRGRWQLELSKDKPGGLFTLIFKKMPVGWRIVHDHTSVATTKVDKPE